MFDHAFCEGLLFILFPFEVRLVVVYKIDHRVWFPPRRVFVLVGVEANVASRPFKRILCDSFHVPNECWLTYKQELFGVSFGEEAKVDNCDERLRRERVCS